ncbi:MAG: DUF2608 domain-containing protein [Holosporales bacterium]|nr:DUF2608 domain-containing protein [Holosporales bacterium]
MQKCSTLKSTKSVEELYSFVTDFRKTIDGSQSECLAVFDVDQTLIRAVPPVASSISHKVHEDLFKRLLSELPIEQEYLLAHLPLSVPSNNAVREEKTVDVFNKLHEDGHPVIALTASLTGPFESYERFEVFRFNLLKDLGFNFSEIYQEPEVPFSGFVDFRGLPPSYYKGMINTNGLFGGRSKGKILMACLDKLNTVPCGVIFVDDVEANVHGVAEAMEVVRVPCLSILYNAALWRHEELAEESDFESYWTAAIAEIKQNYLRENNFMPSSRAL